jgi:hypothetical protein
MFKRIFKAINSHLSQNKTYAAINIAGLAIGIGCSLVIFKIIAFESSFDNYHSNFENIYRLITEYKAPKEGIKYEEGQVPPVGEAIRNEFPGVDAVMTFYAAKGQIDQISIENENGDIQRYQENTGLVCADPNIFKVFDFNFLAGNPSRALLNKGSVVISSSLAQKYFGLSEPEIGEAMNRFITINNIANLQVTGVISDPPMNTDLPFTIIANYEDQIIINPYYGGNTDWQAGHSYTIAIYFCIRICQQTLLKNNLWHSMISTMRKKTPRIGDMYYNHFRDYIRGFATTIAIVRCQLKIY